MNLLNVEMQRNTYKKNKNVKYGGSDKQHLKSSLQTCNNKSRKELNKVAFLSGLPRFDAKKSDTLGPGIYNISLPKCQTEKNGKFAARPRDFEINLSVPPDTYTDCLQHHTIKTRVEKKITPRGPYDTFTGPRDSSTLVGLSAEKKSYLISDNWPLPLESYVTKNRYNRTYTNLFVQKKSRRKKLESYEPKFSCVNMPNWRSKKINKYFTYQPIYTLYLSRYPFNCSLRIGDSLKTIENSLRPGPGHYMINVSKKCAVNGHTNVFKSTTVRSLPITR